MNPFRAWRRTENDWFSVGLTSSFPDLDDTTTALSSPRECTGLADSNPTPGCKAFYVPQEDTSKRKEVPIAEDAADAATSDTGAEIDLTDQVLVFRYRGKFHAIDHVCCHLSGSKINADDSAAASNVRTRHFRFHGVRRLTLRILASCSAPG